MGKKRKDSYDKFECGKRIKLLRNKNNCKQADLAEYLGITPGMITGIETGNKNLSLDVAIELRKKFHVSLDWIYGLTDETGDKASDILCNLKKVFDIDLTEKSIVIDNSLAALLERINNAYESYKNYRLTDDEFNTLIEGAKRIYNEESNYNNVEPENKTKYYFQTFEEQLMEILSPKIK